MTKYKVLLSKTSLSQFHKLETETRERIKDCLKGLEDDPFHHRSGADIKKLVNVDEPPFYRLRIGDYRVIYAKTRDGVLVLRIGHRKNVY